MASPLRGEGTGFGGAVALHSRIIRRRGFEVAHHIKVPLDNIDDFEQPIPKVEENDITAKSKAADLWP